MADGQACAALGQVHPQAWDKRDTTAEAEGHIWRCSQRSPTEAVALAARVARHEIRPCSF